MWYTTPEGAPETTDTGVYSFELRHLGGTVYGDVILEVDHEQAKSFSSPKKETRRALLEWLTKTGQNLENPNPNFLVSAMVKMYELGVQEFLVVSR